MPYWIFLWDGENEEHVDQHGVTMSEFESVVMDPDDVVPGRSRDRFEATGETATGKTLLCVYEVLPDGITVYSITAFEI